MTIILFIKELKNRRSLITMTNTLDPKKMRGRGFYLSKIEMKKGCIKGRVPGTNGGAFELSV